LSINLVLLGFKVAECWCWWIVWYNFWVLRLGEYNLGLINLFWLLILVMWLIMGRLYYIIGYCNLFGLGK